MLLNVGDKVRIIGSFPIENIGLDLRNEPGVVVGIHRAPQKGSGPKDWNLRGNIELVRIRLDRHIELLTPWDNEVHFDYEINLQEILDMVTVVERKPRR